eukprot:gene12465-biopygen1785
MRNCSMELVQECEQECSTDSGCSYPRTHRLPHVRTRIPDARDARIAQRAILASSPLYLSGLGKGTTSDDIHQCWDSLRTCLQNFEDCQGATGRLRGRTRGRRLKYRFQAPKSVVSS